MQAKNNALIPESTTLFEFLAERDIAKGGGEQKNVPLSVLDLVRIKDIYGIIPPPNSTLEDVANIISSGDFPIQAQEQIEAQVALQEFLTKKQLSALDIAGVSLDIASNIVTLILQGASNAEIRQGLIERNENPSLLDAFDRAVGIDKIRFIGKPKTSGAIDFSGLDISKLLEEE